MMGGGRQKKARGKVEWKQKESKGAKGRMGNIRGGGKSGIRANRENMESLHKSENLWGGVDTM